MQTSPPRLWDGVLRRLGADLDPHTIAAWIGPLAPCYETLETGAARLTLACPSAFHSKRVRERLLHRIASCVDAEAGKPVVVELVVAAPAAEAEAEACAAATDASATGRERPRAAAATAAAPTLRAVAGRGSGARTAAARPQPESQQTELPYRFDNFVVGSCNALAREASLALAHGSQHEMNPLVLSSESGMGKTHLARAIVDEARRHGEERILYTSAEAFTGEFTSALVAKRAEHFKRRYRHGCRLLVLEDVQFLDARKKATQGELFHTVQHLLDCGARVVFTTDRLPRDIEGLAPRLRSQLSSGLVAELEPPDATLRREILRRKAADGGVRLPEECRELLVESARGSVRDLVGVLIQLVASASLLQRPIDAELTAMALRKLAPRASAPARLEIHEVLESVSAYFKKRPDELAARSKRRDVLVPRQLAMYLCRRYTDAPLAQIGAALGRDHSAVSHAVRKVEREMLERVPLRYQVEALCARLDDMLEGR